MITIHILPNISRSKVILEINVEYSMKNIFLKKSYTEFGAETSSWLFYKISKLSISLDQQSEILCSSFLLYVELERYQNILKLSTDHLLLPNRAFWKIKKRSVTVFPTLISAWFFKKIFHIIVYQLTLHSSNIVWLVAFPWQIGQHVYYNYLSPCLWQHKF